MASNFKMNLYNIKFEFFCKEHNLLKFGYFEKATQFGKISIFSKNIYFLSNLCNLLKISEL